MSNREIHSVILNLNKNYSQNKGSSFSTIVNRQLEIKPNTEIALYGGSLTRAPIIIEKDTVLEMNFNYAFPTKRQRDLPSLATNLLEGNLTDADGDATSQTKLSVGIPKGSYSKLGFTKEVCNAFNKVLIDNIPNGGVKESTIEPVSGTEALECLPYRMAYEIKDGNYWLGLRYHLEVPRVGLTQESPFLVGHQDLNDGLTTESEIQLLNDDEYQLGFGNSSNTVNWNSYLLGNSPIRGLAYSKLTDTDDFKLATDASWANFDLRTSATAHTGDVKMLFALNNTWMADKWGASAAVIPDLKTIVGEAETIPQCLIGALFEATSNGTNLSNQRISIVVNEAISQNGYSVYANGTNRDAFLASNLRRVAKIDVTQYDIDLDVKGNSFAFDVYCENIPKELPASQRDGEYNSMLDRIYYFRFLMRSPWGDSYKVIYDSKSDGTSINRAHVESGYLFQQLVPPSGGGIEVSGGLCPQFYFNSGGGGGSSVFRVYNPRANNIAGQADGNTKFIINKAQIEYSLTCPFKATFTDTTVTPNKVYKNTNPTSMQNTLLISEDTSGVQSFGTASQLFNVDNTVSYDPNIYPSNKDISGLTELGSDGTRYNIEVNLPVRAYNTTTQASNDIGQTRTILYNTNPLVSNASETTSSIIQKDIEPNNLKYLSLNNPQSIKLNELNITVRRANTNELATEITDASLEILLQKE
tara:strand:- start:45 stop:2141 length:2097 start_codon:yes stop_codon:yes gene_type:complete